MEREIRGRLSRCILFSCPACLFVTLFLLGTLPVLAQTVRRITEVSLTSTGSVRLVTEPLVPNPDFLLLESSDSIFGPWWKETETLRNDLFTGYEFLTPRKPYHSQRFYRIAPFGAGLVLPFIRFFAPNNGLRPGLPVTLLGANFSSTLAGNTVLFERPGQMGIGTVTEAGSNYLMLTVPTNLLTASTGLFYRVTVTTSQGTGNGVGCKIYSLPAGFDTFQLRPSQAYIIQAPGTGTETLVAGGGIPPYRLVPQSSNDSSRILAQLNGPVLTVTAATNVSYATIDVSVEDSSVPPQRAASFVVLQAFNFTPTLTTAFHTLLAGTAPGFTITAEFNSLQPEQLEMRLQNAQIDLSQLRPGAILG